MGRLLSLPGIVLLIVVTGLAAALIFEPARRRLDHLERATRAIGAGDLSARAPEGGSDEIAYLAKAFNTMAADLAAREEALRTSDRLRRQMLADVSHELKTPLTAMRGYVETLHMSDLALDPATRERYFATLERETSRLDRIIKDLLDLARLENGVGTLDVRLFAIDRVFEHVAASPRARGDEPARSRIHAARRRHGRSGHGRSRTHRTGGRESRGECDCATRRPDGTVEMAADARTRIVVVTVADSGVGIPPEHLPFVFDRFYKVDPSRASDSEGSGLGLSISKAIVERHGGTMSVSSVPGRTVVHAAEPCLKTVAARRTHSSSANL